MYSGLPGPVTVARHSGRWSCSIKEADIVQGACQCQSFKIYNTCDLRIYKLLYRRAQIIDVYALQLSQLSVHATYPVCVRLVASCFKSSLLDA